MRVLGLDPSLTAFGWAVHDSNALGEARCPARGRFTTPPKMEFVSRYIHMRESLRDLIREVKPDRMGIEFPVFGEMYSEGMYGLFLYCCEAIKSEGQDVVFWTPMQVKAHARDSLERPKGWRMDKPDMVEAAKRDTHASGVGKGRWNHNEADAYLVGRLAARFWLLYEGQISEADLTPRERKYFLEVKTYARGKKAGKTEHKGMSYREDDRFFLWSQG